jgi:hypothetical protein
VLHLLVQRSRRLLQWLLVLYVLHLAVDIWHYGLHSGGIHIRHLLLLHSLLLWHLLVNHTAIRHILLLLVHHLLLWLLLLRLLWCPLRLLGRSSIHLLSCSMLLA